MPAAIYLTGDPSPLLSGMNAADVVDRLAGATSPGAWLTFPALAPEGKPSRSLYVRSGAVSAVCPMPDYEVREFLDELPED